MRSINKILAIFALLFFLPAHADSEETPVGPPMAEVTPMKTIELEWEAIDNAFGYEILLTPEGGGAALTFKTEEPKFSREIPVGVYRLKIRARHKEFADHWSPWSDPMTVEVLSKELSLIYPAENAVLKAPTDERLEVRFEWTPVDNAKDYTIKIWTEETKDDPITFVTRKNSQRLKLIPSRVYFWQVTFESANNVSYVQQAKTSTFILEGPKLVEPSIKPFAANEVKTKLSWTASEKTKAYKATLNFRFIDDPEWKTKKQKTLSEPVWEFGRLKPGVYKLEVVATAPRHASSDPGTYEFSVKPTLGEVRRALATFQSIEE